MKIVKQLRETNRAAMRELVARLAPQHVEKVDWDADTIDDYIASLEWALNDITEADGMALINALGEIELVLNEIGYAAMRSIVARDRRLLERFDAEPDQGARAIRLMLENRKLFDWARRSAEGDRRLSRPKASTFFLGENALILDFQRRNWRQESGIEQELQSAPLERPPGGRIVVNGLCREMRDPRSGDDRSMLFLTIHAEGPITTSERIDPESGDLMLRVEPDMIQSFALIDPNEQTISVIAPGGEAKVEKLAQIIASALAPDHETLTKIERRPLDLQRLLSIRSFQIRADDPVEQIQIVSLTIASKDDPNDILVLSRKDRSGRSSVFDVADQNLSKDRPLTSDFWNVRAAQIRFHFSRSANQSDRRSPTVTLSSTNRAPNRNDLHQLLEHQRMFVTECLEREGVLSTSKSALGGEAGEE